MKDGKTSECQGSCQGLELDFKLTSHLLVQMCSNLFHPSSDELSSCFHSLNVANNAAMIIFINIFSTSVSVSVK